MAMMDELWNVDKEIAEVTRLELKRQQKGLELIPSENYVSKAVLQAAGSIFTNKYSEGYAGKRYYGGQDFVDRMEEIAIARAKKLFGAEHVNVQPYSGSPANQAVFHTLMKPKETFLGFDLTAGGHLTHGSPVNFSGKLFTCEAYNVDPETHLLDMDAIRKRAEEVQPKMIISGLTAYPRKIDFKEFQAIADDVGAYHMADISHISGLCATGVHQSPVPYADVVTSTTHKTLRGPRGGIIMCKKDDRLKEKYYPKSKKSLAGRIDFNVFPGLQGGPHDHINAAKAVAFGEALQPEFTTYAQQIVKNAKALADSLMNHGLKLITEGTDNHLILIDLCPQNLLGKGELVQQALDEVGITLNKNTIPYEPSSPFHPSGLRLGTPAITTRGMKENEMDIVGEAIALVVKNHDDPEAKQKAKELVDELCYQFPLYDELDILR